MGFKLFMVGATRKPGCFGAPGENDRAGAAALARQLTATDHVYMGEVPLPETLYPGDGELFVGAYADGVLVSHAGMAGLLVDNGDARPPRGVRADARRTLLELAPGGEVLAMVLHSVVDWWGFASYADGDLRRMAAGSADDGVFIDTGTPLPEERPMLAGATLARLDEEGEGEELVLAVSARLFGRGIDALEEPVPMLSHYRRPPRGPVAALKKLFGC